MAAFIKVAQGLKDVCLTLLYLMLQGYRVDLEKAELLFDLADYVVFCSNCCLLKSQRYVLIKFYNLHCYPSVKALKSFTACSSSD